MTERPRKKTAAPQICELVAAIERYEQTYYLSEYGTERAASDEALIEITGRIVRIAPKYRQHLEQPIEITFACATSYAVHERTPASDRPFLLPMNLGQARRGFMAYLPAAVLWALPNMIDGGRLTHIEARFNAPRYGSGSLRGVYLMPKSKFDGADAR